MNIILRGFVFIACLGIAKAHGFIKVVILAGLGLAGLWMVHTLAQDFNRIQGNGNGGGGGVRALADLFAGGSLGSGRNLEKRSINQGQDFRINWDLVLARDPASCARSFICQLAASDQTKLDATSKRLLDITKNSIDKDDWAAKQLLAALKDGEKASNPNQCMKIYKLCPYSARTMLSLLNIFG